jgi:hypothetical protein
LDNAFSKRVNPLKRWDCATSAQPEGAKFQRIARDLGSYTRKANHLALNHFPVPYIIRIAQPFHFFGNEGHSAQQKARLQMFQDPQNHDILIHIIQGDGPVSSNALQNSSWRKHGQRISMEAKKDHSRAD